MIINLRGVVILADLIDKIIEERVEDLAKLGERRSAYITRMMSLVAPIVKSWYLRTSVNFLNERDFKEEQEDLFAEFTDFCTEKLDELCDSRNYSARNV